MSENNQQGTAIENAERREVLSALMKYSVAVGGASATVLTASQAVARSAASGSAQAEPTERWQRENWGEQEWAEWREKEARREEHRKAWWEARGGR